MEVFFKRSTKPAQSPGQAGKTYQELKVPGTRILPITVDKQGRERIGFVKKASFAQYLQFHTDPHFIRSLPDFHLPMLGVGSFRAFEVADDSMTPLEPGAIVVGEYIQDWEKLTSGKTFVFVHKELGIMYRRLYKTSHHAKLKLVAEKEEYQSLIIDLAKVHEIWQARMYMSL